MGTDKPVRPRDEDRHARPGTVTVRHADMVLGNEEFGFIEIFHATAVGVNRFAPTG